MPNQSNWADVKNIYTTADDQFKDQEGEYLNTKFGMPEVDPAYFLVLSFSPHDTVISFYRERYYIDDYKPDFSFEFNESVDTAKEAVEKTIEHFSNSNNKNFTIGEIEKHLKSKILYNSNQVKENLKRATDVLATGESQTVQNGELGEIFIDKGLAGKNGYGLLHIIENRSKEGKNDEETTAIVHLVTQAAKEGEINRNITDKNNPEKVRRVELEKDGIIALISLQRNHNEEKWVLTGFDDKNKKEEAAEAVQTVIAKYSHSPEFSYFRKQVGAAVSSLEVSPQSHDKSIEINTAQKTGYVQGVCESVLAFNTDENRKIMSEATMTFLSKRLLSEMNVTKDMAQKFANPETYKALEQSVFAPKHEQQLEQTQSHGRSM